MSSHRFTARLSVVLLLVFVSAQARAGGPCEPPVIDGQPFPAMSLCPGMTLILSCFADGTDLEFQWQKNGVDIPGQTSTYLSIGNVNQSHSGSYRCFVHNACGEQMSNASVITVTNDRVPILTDVPDPQDVCVGADVELTIQFEGNPNIIRWRKDGQIIQGADQPTLLLEDVTAEDAGNYTVHIENMCGSSTSGPIAVQVSSSGNPDINGDGFINGGDIQPLVTAFLDAVAGDSQALCIVDLNEDGQATEHDIVMFLIAIFGKD